MRLPVELALLILLVATAVVITRLRHLFAAAMLTGIFSLLSAGLFTLMDAVDVAFTEAAVGAGITTLLFLGTLSLAEHQEYQQAFRLRPLLVVLLTGGALIYGTFEMPRYGDPGAPIHHHVAPDYIAGAAEDIHIPNVVTVVLGSYRGYDTLGETVVIFTAGIGVLMLLGWPRRRLILQEPAEGAVEASSAGSVGAISEIGSGVRAGGRRSLSEKPILSVVARLMVPFILLFALYVQFHGDFGPGGGFQAGVIFAAGLILYGLVFGGQQLEDLVPPRVAEISIAVGVLIFGGVGVLTLLLGGNFLDYDALDAHHGQHWGIIAIELGVGITVAATMLRIYNTFSALRRSGS